jgi:AcrR family transcriptional regulator
VARRQAILDAAIAVFAERGFPAATMDEIAERAGLGKGTLYNYFDDKRHLLEAACDEANDGLVALAERFFADAARRGAPARAVFHGFIAALTSFFLTHHAALVVQAREALRLALEEGGDHRFLLVRQRDRLAAVMEGPLEEAMRRGELRRLPAREVANVIVGNVHARLMDVACGAGRPSSDDLPGETAEFIATILFDGLLAETS